MYILLDLDKFSEFINIVYSVQVGREVRFAHRRNLPLSRSTAVENRLDYVNSIRDKTKKRSTKQTCKWNIERLRNETGTDKMADMVLGP